MDLWTAFKPALGAITLAATIAVGAIMITGAATASATTAASTGGKVQSGPPKSKKVRGRASAPIARTPATAAPRPARHLILIPGGGFTFHDANFWPTMAPAASAAGFVPHLLKYRLFDLGGAVADAREHAADLVRRYGRANVFVYGSSAGGTLAALLASEGLAAAGVASSGLYDFRYWPWALLDRGPEYLYSIGADWDTRRAYSPIRHRLRCPLLSLHGNWDPVVSVFQAEDYVATHPRATLRLYSAGHGLYRTRPNSVVGAMRWLNRVGNKQAKISRQPIVRGARAAEAARRIRCS